MKAKSRVSKALAGVLAAVMLMSNVLVTVKAEESEQNLALSATPEMECGANLDKYPLSMLNDGSIGANNGALSKDNVSFPQYITLTWEQPCSFNKIELYSSFARDQGITKWDIETTTDGESWSPIALDVKADWTTSSDDAECKSVIVQQQTDVKGVRFEVKESAFTWKHFFITEVKIFNDTANADQLEQLRGSLAEFIGEAEGKVEQTSEYTEESLAALQEAISEAQLEYENKQSHSDAIERSIEALKNSIEKLQSSTTFEINANGCEGAGAYPAGTVVTVTAPYDGEHAFTKWTVEGLEEKDGINFSQNPLIFTMPENEVTLTPEFQTQSVVSQVVVGENGKDYLEVDGKPWFYTFVQNMGKWERMGHQEEFKENSGSPDPNYPTAELPLSFFFFFYEKTAHLNYSTISQALMWRDIETAPGQYDFTVIDQYVEWAKKYGMKLDLAWFGSACQSGTRIPGYSSAPNGEGRRVDLGYQYTAPAWYVQDEQGKAIDTYYKLWNPGSVTYDLKVTGENAEYMKQQEYYALQAIFNHLAEVDPDHTVIAIQIENEANMRNSGWPELTDWMNYLGKAVKESGYVVATRLNYSGWGYPVNVNNLEYIDFAGTDPYTTSVSSIKSILRNGEGSSTLTYIAENSGNYENLTSLATAAFAEGGFYGTWALDNWFCDGGGGHFNGPHSIYKNNQKYYEWQLGEIPDLTSQAEDVLHYNEGLNKMGPVIAAASKNEIMGLNVDTDKPKETYDNVKRLGGYTFGYEVEDASVGIAVLNGQNIYVTSDTAGSMLIKTGQKPLKVTSGKIDNDGNWIAESEKNAEKNKEGMYCVELNTEECIQMQMPEGVEMDDANLALKATAESTSIDDSAAIGNINDGDEWTGIKSMKNPAYPQYITLKWETAQSFDEVGLLGIYAQGQNPTNWDIEVSKDGENDWTRVASSGDVKWETNDDRAEKKSIEIPRQTQMQGLRIKINNANTEWGAYYVTELQVFDNMAIPEMDTITVTPPRKVNYKVGDELNLEGMVVTANYSDGTTKDVTNESVITGYDPKSPGEQEITVAYKEKTATFTVTVQGEVDVPDIVDKTALQALYEANKDKEESSYTEESWKVFKETLDKAEEVLSNDAATEEEVNTATEALQSAAKALTKVSIADKTGLAAMISMIEGLSQQDYRAASWNTLMERLDLARGIMEDQKATQGMVDTIYTDLVQAWNGLEDALNTSAADPMVEQAESVLAEADKYRPSDIENIQTALQAVRDAIAVEETTQEELDSLTMSLCEALINLKEQVDAGSLQKMADLAGSLLADREKYTSSSAQALEDALNDAAAVLEDENRTQEQVSGAYQALTNAMAGLQKRGNKEVMEPLLEKAGQVLSEASKYSAASLEGLQEALEAAQGVYDNEDAMQKEINEAASALAQELAQVRILGDVNNDGKVDTADAANVLAANAELEELDDAAAGSADVNRDGAVDTRDAAEIQKYAAELITEF